MQTVYLYVEERDSKGEVAFATECIGILREDMLYVRKCSFSDLMESYEVLEVKLSDCQEFTMHVAPVGERHFSVVVPEIVKPRADPRFNILPEWFVGNDIVEAIEACIVNRERQFKEIYG